MTEPQWYVLHTYSGYENKVAQTLMKVVNNRADLKDLITEVRVPTETVTEFVTDKNDKRVEKTYERKIFPGYVCVKMVVTDETWYIARNTRGVTGFVSPSSNKPIPLDLSEVRRMGLDTEEVVRTAEADIRYKVGDTVKINNGPLEGWTGKVTEIDKESHTVTVSVAMFGRNTDTSADISDVSLADL
jgi:transcriptional antiterminator NusG